MMVDSRELFPSKQVHDRVLGQKMHISMYHFGYSITKKVMINDTARQAFWTGGLRGACSRCDVDVI